ncbi:CoA transferase [Bradyrhizobium sp. 139]|uniref:CoA transferase n=1 Tax=Bradyrhizobium sp. 139 TaxID=2782616 RepID=UPI001FF93CE2|nr:CoA transferase [Bradyrhizobium sp. 139]
MFIDDYKAGDLNGYELDYNSIRIPNPDIIYCSVTVFGQTGPDAPRVRLTYHAVMSSNPSSLILVRFGSIAR